MPRITIQISEETFLQLKEFSVKDRRSLSTTADLLLQQAIKEKNRKRKLANDQENNS
jgi:hypothetical protein